MNDKQLQLHRNQALGQRSLRDELLFAYTISKRDIPKDIALFILGKSYFIRTQKGMYTLDFKLLNARALVDFLYFTNEQEKYFLKMYPRIDSKERCIELTLENEDNIFYWDILPQEVKKYPTKTIELY